MGLLQKAVETYDNMSHFVGVPRENHPALLPVSHIIQNAQIEITLDRDGNFIKAEAVSKDNAKTVIPVTEKSGGRTGNVIEPHPFSDQLEYVSGSNPKKFAAYLAGLEAWVNSAYTHPKVKAVRNYVKTGKILRDLSESGVIALDGGGKTAKGKDSDSDCKKCLVRWRVLGTGDREAAWEDLRLFKAYTDYYAAKLAEEEKNLCMIAGTYDYIGTNHPKGITATKYEAKLISANDRSGLTYRGRFSKSWQASTVGYTASQKAHSALQWVTADQGVVHGGRTFVCWNPKGLKVQHAVTVLSMNNEKPLSPTEYKKELYHTISGLRNDLPDNEDVIIAAFDAATKGRLSLTYYNELRASDFYDRIHHWYETCSWENDRFGVQSPTLCQIAESAFGTEGPKGHIELDARVLREQTQRLMTCITDRAPIPHDVVRALAHRASALAAYGKSNRAEVLFTACAVIRKCLNDKLNKEEWTMAFDPLKKDRDYQYGCLLAVMEKIERETYNAEEEREPNAIRLQSAFCQKPLHTAKVLNEKVTPYLARLSPNRRAYYQKRLGEIIETIAECEGARINAPLGDTYLFGYYLQKQALYPSHKNRTEEN